MANGKWQTRKTQMAFIKAENKKFSGILGWWKPKEGETLHGVILSIFDTGKIMDGKRVTPFYVVEILNDGKGLTVMEGSGKSAKAVKVKKGDQIGVNRTTQLEATLDDHPGCAFQLTFVKYIALDGGKKVKDFGDVLVDPEKVRPEMTAIPWRGAGAGTESEEETDDQTETPA
jgi:hypothetical protein